MNVKANVLGVTPLCSAFASGLRELLSNLQSTAACGSGFRDLLLNLQTTAVAWSCFAKHSASWLYMHAKVKSDLLGDVSRCSASAADCLNRKLPKQVASAGDFLNRWPQLESS